MDYGYCEKCGRVIFSNPYHIEYCDVCATIIKPLPEEFISKDEILTNKATEERLSQPGGFYEQLKKTPTFDQQMFDKRYTYLEERRKKWASQESEKIRQSIVKPNIPKCPTCQSTNINKISGTKRWLTVGLFGLASSDAGKTMQCSNCGYKW